MDEFIYKIKYSCILCEESIVILIGDAHHSLREIKKLGPFDFVFIDAEKPSNPVYFDWAIKNVRLGGIIATHNAFRKGTVVGAGEDDDHSELMRQFNQQVAKKYSLLVVV